MASASTRRSSRLKVDEAAPAAPAPATQPAKPRPNKTSAASTSSSKPPRPEYKVDDCVMLRSDTLGEPYFLGRIMSFPDPTHVRIAWFYRPQDVLSKTKAYPPRLLVASMHSDINPLRSIVAKCTIKHVAEIGTGSDADLAAYVQQDHTFYYAQLFDRFTKRVYDVVPTHTVTNRPPEVLAKIKQFPYILVEEGKDKELKASYQECRMCGQWVPKDDALECVECHCVYHATCLAQVKKPRPGYKWQCHFCTVGLPVPEPPAARTTNEQAASDQLQDPYPDGDMQQVLTLDDSRPSSPPTTGSRPRTSSNTFPWTYFGIHCTNTDAAELDPRHPFYPRIASRIASKYQATIPKLTVAGAGDSSSGRGGRNSLSGGAGVSAAGAKGKKKQAGAAADPAGTLRHVSLAHTGLSEGTSVVEYLNGPGPTRGDGSGLVFDGGNEQALAAADELFSQLTTLDKPLALPAHSTALLDRAMFELHHSGYSVPATLSILTQLDATHILSGTYPSTLASTLPADRLTLGALHTQAESTPWTDQDNATFVDAVKLHGFDLQAIHEKCMPQRSMPTLVLHLYRNKKNPSVEQALAVFLHDVVGVSSPTMALEGMFESQMAGRGTGSRIKSPEPSASGGADLMSSDSEPEDIEATQCTLCKGTSASGRYVLTNVALSTPRPVVDDHVGIAVGTGAVSVADEGPQTVTHANLGVANPDACHVLCDTCGRYWMMYGGLRPAQVGEDGGYQDAMDVDEDEAGGRKKTAAAAPRRTRKRQANDGEDLSELSDVDDASATTQQQQPAAKKRKVSTAEIAVEADPPTKKAAAGKRSRTNTGASASGDMDLDQAAQAPRVPTPTAVPAPAPVAAEPAMCHMCREDGDTLLKCADCGLCVHDTCYCPAPLPNSARSTPHGSTTSLPGLALMSGSGRTTPPLSSTSSAAAAGTTYPMRKWRCGPCVNVRHPTDSLDTQCLLCPHEFPCTPAQPMKRTAKRNWVHAMCALFVPEVKVGSADSLEPISGIDEIPKFRWESLCSICTVPGGVTVSCAEQGCGKEFHVSCAFRAGCYFGLLEQHVPSTAGRTKTVSVPNVWCRQHVISDANVDPACKAALMHAAGVAAAGTSGKGGKKSGGKAAQQQQQALIPHGLHVLEEGGDPFPPGDIDWRTKKGERMEIISRPVMRAVLDYAIHHKRAAPAATSRRRNYPILTGIQPSMAAPPTASVNAARAVISGVRASLSAHSSMEFHAQQQHMQEQQHDDQSDPGQGAGGLKIKLKLGGGATPASGAPSDLYQQPHLAGPKCSSCLQRTSPVWWPAEVVLAQVDGHLKNGDAHIVRLAADATAPRLCMACFART